MTDNIENVEQQTETLEITEFETKILREIKAEHQISSVRNCNSYRVHCSQLKHIQVCFFVSLVKISLEVESSQHVTSRNHQGHSSLYVYD